MADSIRPAANCNLRGTPRRAASRRGGGSAPSDRTPALQRRSGSVGTCMATIGTASRDFSRYTGVATSASCACVRRSHAAALVSTLELSAAAAPLAALQKARGAGRCARDDRDIVAPGQFDGPHRLAEPPAAAGPPSIGRRFPAGRREPSPRRTCHLFSTGPLRTARDPCVKMSYCARIAGEAGQRPWALRQARKSLCARGGSSGAGAPAYGDPGEGSGS